MKSKEEIKTRLQRIKENYERDRPKPSEKCECCGQHPPFMGTWMLGNSARYEGRIRELEWVIE